MITAVEARRMAEEVPVSKQLEEIGQVISDAVADGYFNASTSIIKFTDKDRIQVIQLALIKLGYKVSVDVRRNQSCVFDISW